jgi:hypothetical protein
LIIVLFQPFHRDSLIDTLFFIAGFTYGPLLGLYAFGLFTKYRARDSWIPVIAVISPVATYFLHRYCIDTWDFDFGFVILLINGLVTFLLLWLSKPVTGSK